MDTLIQLLIAGGALGAIGAVWYFTRNIKLTAAVCVVFLAFGAGWKLRDYQAGQEGKAELEAALDKLKVAIEERDALAEKMQADSAALEQKLALLRAQKEKTRIIRVREYAKPAYTECIVPNDGVQLLNEAIAGANAARPAR